MTTLFDSYDLGSLTLRNRMVMAPMTRNRATADGVATDMMATYYAQRAGAGLIIGESAPVSQQGVGYPHQPSLFTPEQAAGWKKSVDAIHEKGGKIFAQIMHTGRISHPDHQEGGALAVAPSALKAAGQAVTPNGFVDHVAPRALALEEIPGVVEQFRTAARFAKEAGFDGIEIHGANGYLIDQFLRDGTNHREDAYGGTPENRLRFLNEVVDAVLTVWPADRVGVRLSPENGFNDMSDSDPQGHFTYFTEELGKRDLAFLHVLEGDMVTGARSVDYVALRAAYRGHYIANNGYDLGRAQDALASSAADLVAFGAPFLANPDLVERFQKGQPLNEADQATFYGGDETGYTDYPVHPDNAVASERAA